MAKPYDVTTKFLVENNPRDWVRYLRFPDGPVQIEDTDLTTLVAEADKVLRVLARHPYLLHLEFQSGPDESLIVRLFRYCLLLHIKYGLPIETVLILLRDTADGPLITGEWRVPGIGRRQVMTFKYRVLRVWQIEPETLLGGGLSLLPLAPVSNVTPAEAENVTKELITRIRREAPTPALKTHLLTATFVLLGLRYNDAFAQRLMEGVREMEESTTYQWIKAQGRQEGLQTGRQEGYQEGRIAELVDLLLKIGAKRFGTPTAAVTQTIQSLKDRAYLESLVERLIQVESWDEFLEKG
jgi:predicted transposase YdaD